MIIGHLTQQIPNCAGVSDLSDRFEILFNNGTRRLATAQEIADAQAAQDAAQAQAADDSASATQIKAAIAQLDTIIAGIDTATTAQVRDAVKIALIDMRHLIKAVRRVL